MKTLTETVAEAIAMGVSADGIVEAIKAGLDAEEERCAQICAHRAASLRESLSLTSGGKQGLRDLDAYMRGFADGSDDCADAIRRSR
jgi:hypothetical protein